MTTDYGKTWKRSPATFPTRAAWVHVVREDPRNRNLLYIGTEMGVWASWDAARTGRRSAAICPSTPVRDIQIHPRDNDILLATHGRGLYIMDDATRAAESQRRHNRPTRRCSTSARPCDGRSGTATATSARRNGRARIRRPARSSRTILKTQPPGEVNITISDKAGRVVRRMRRVADDAGLNRVAWDLRPDPPPGLAAGGGRGGRGGGGARTAAPRPRPDTSLAAVRARRAAAAAIAEPDQPADEGGGGGGGRGGGGATRGVAGDVHRCAVGERKAAHEDRCRSSSIRAPT